MLARRPRCTIGIAPPGDGAPAHGDLRRLGVGFDGSREADQALKAAIDLANGTGATLRVLTVVGLPYYAAEKLAWPFGARARRVLHEHFRAQLDRAMAAVPASVDAEAVLLSGEPAAALAEAATGLDLLILGSRGYGPLRRLLVGSTSAKLAKSSPCAVLIVPPGGKHKDGPPSRP